MAEKTKNIVLEIGSGTFKAGYSGETYPAKVFRNLIAKTAGGAETLFGDDFKEKIGGLQFSYPVQNGFVQNLEEEEKLIDYAYQKKLQIKPDAQPVLIVECPGTGNDIRQKLAELLFEKFNVPALATLHKAFASLYETGKTTALFHGSGENISYFCPIYDGHEVQYGIAKVNFGGKNITESLFKAMTSNGVAFPYKRHESIELVREIKEKYCYFPANFADEIKKVKEEEYTLPDSTVVKVKDERITSPEEIFSAFELCQACKDCVLQCDMNIRKELYKNIVCTGGNTLLPGYETRFAEGLKPLVPPGIQKVLSVTKPKGKYPVWSGASVYADLSVFDDQTVKLSEYKEAGAGIINKKIKK